MNRTRSIATITIALAVVFLMALAGSAMAQTVTSASGDTVSPGDQATVSVDAQDVTSVAINDIPDSWSVDSQASNPDGGTIIGNAQTDVVVSYATAGEQSSVSISLVLDVPSNAATGDNDLEVVASGTGGPDDTATATVTVQQQQQQTGTITVETGSQGDNVDAVNAQSGVTEASGTTGANGEVDLTVPANTLLDIAINGNERVFGVSVNPGQNINVDATPGTLGGAQDPVDANGNRIVGGPGGNSGTIFLGEDDIALNQGVFRGVAPGQFTDVDDNILTIDNGVVEPDNAITTYTLTVGGTTRVVEVREARVQGVFVVDALANERLDASETREIEQTQAGDDFNVQIVADYNYFASTSIDTVDLLTQDGSDVTGIYLEGTQDTALDAGGPFTSVDERQRTYDFLANFDVDDTGEYTANIAPRSGDERSDGRDVGFVTREDAADSEVFTIIDDEDVELELGSTEANQGDRVDYNIIGLLEGEVAAVTIEENDLRIDDFGTFEEAVSNYDQTGRTIGDDNPIEFFSDSFRGVDELRAKGLVFRATRSGGGIGAPGVDERDFILFETSDIDDVEVYRVDGNTEAAAPVEITDQVLGTGTLDLTRRFDTQGNRLDTELDDVATALGNADMQLERVFGTLIRDEGETLSQIDTEKLDDTSIDVEAFGDVGERDAEGIRNADPFNLSESLVGAFAGRATFRNDDDEVDLEVEEVEITVDSPGETYVPGTEVDLTGSITGTADDVVIMTRDRDNYFHIETETTDRSAGDYDETNFELSADARTDQARDILSQPGVYRYGVIDGIDTDIIELLNPGRDILANRQGQGGADGLEEADFNQGASTQVSLRVVEPSLEANFLTFDGGIYEPDGLDVRGTLVGPREYVTFLTDDRGNSIVEEFNADESDGEIDEDNIALSATVQGQDVQLTEGEIQGSILSFGRDTQFGDGSFRIPGLRDDATDQSTIERGDINNFIEFAEELSLSTRTQEQVREILLDQTVRQSGSDDLIVTEEFRLTDDSRTSIEDIVPGELRDNLTGVQPIEIGETMVIRGTTNRNPDDATIVVEAEDGPSIAEVGTAVSDEWPADGEEDADRPGGVWTAEIEIDEEVEPGEYLMRADDGDRIDDQTVEIVAEGTLEEGERLESQVDELRQQVQELEGQVETLEGERDELESQVSDLESQNSDLQSELESTQQELEQAQQQQNETDTGEEEEEEGQPGFTAVAALVALIAVALLALRRREEDE